MASGEAQAILMKAQATGQGIDAVARAIAQGKDAAQGAVSLSVAEKYVDAFANLAKEGTSVIIPGNVGDIGGMIASAMAVYGKVNNAQTRGVAAGMLGEGQDTPAGKKIADLERQLADVENNTGEVKDVISKVMDQRLKKR